MVGSGTGGNAATAALCLGSLQLFSRIWLGFPSSPLPTQLPLATGHRLLHFREGQEDNSHFLKQRLRLLHDDEKLHGNMQGV